MTSGGKLPKRVFIAFDDFSRAGKRVLEFCDVNLACEKVALPELASVTAIFDAQLPAEARDKVRLEEYRSTESSSCSSILFVLLDTAVSSTSEQWELASALSQCLSDADVQEVIVLASVHLPCAKSSATPLHNAYYKLLNLESAMASDSALPLPKFSAQSLSQFNSHWELREPFLCALVHFFQVEQAPLVHLLVVKGYRPGPQHEGTKDATVALASALAAFTSNDLSVDMQRLNHHLASQPRSKDANALAATHNDLHTLLYH